MANRIRDVFSDIGLWLYDVFTLNPEGPGQFDAKSKEATSPLFALFAFVATQSGALAISNQFNIAKWLALTLYIILSLVTIATIARFLRLTEVRQGNLFHYFDRATILLGKFLFYVSIVATCIFAWAYAKGIFGQKAPFTLVTVPMSVPTRFQTHVIKNNGLTQDQLRVEETVGLELFSDVIQNGLKGKREIGDAYITWSISRFDQDYENFKCTVFDAVDPTTCLAFLYSGEPTADGSSQFSIRQVYFDLSPTRLPSRTLSIKSPRQHEQIVLLFYSSNAFAPTNTFELKNQTVLQ